MKKIILITGILITIVSCSSDNDNKSNNFIKDKLTGSWKLVGYYDDIDNDPITGTNYHLVENGDVYKFSSDGTFDNIGDEINPDGTFSVSIDSVLTRNFNSNSLNPNVIFNDKIYILTDETLQFSCYQDGAMCDTYRYQKVTP